MTWTGGKGLYYRLEEETSWNRPPGQIQPLFTTELHVFFDRSAHVPKLLGSTATFDSEMLKQ